jgi:PleD family two-component response regulator
VLSGSLTEVFNKLLAEADEYLYRSKKAGRNCSSMRQSPLEEALKSSVGF